MTIRSSRSAYPVVVATLMLAPVPAAVGQSDQKEASRGALEEIVVTAERRAESQQRVPVAVTSFGGGELERRQTFTTVDVALQVPSLNGNNNVSLGQATSFFMRGIGQDESVSTSDPAVGTYVDGVYIARQIGNNTYLYDIERVEVLRGPQGTLYGRNTSGGAVKIVTRQPSPDAYGYFDAGYGSYDRYEVQGVLNGPLTDALSGKLVGFHVDQDDGIQDNVTLDSETWTSEASGVRGQLLWAPRENMDVRFSADWAEDEGLPPLGSNALGAHADDLFTVESALPGQFTRVEQWGVAAHVDVDFTPTMTLRSISAYRDLSHEFLIDFSDSPGAPGFAIPNDSTHSQVSEELQLLGSTEALDWLIGAFFMYEDNDVEFGEDIFGGLITSRKDMTNTAESFALFGQATYRFTDRWGLTLGLRWTDETRELEIDGATTLLPPLAPSEITLRYTDADLRAAGIDTELEFSEVDPRVALEFQQTPALLWYASYAQGFKAGGWNARVTNPADFVNYEPETVDSYEVGLKSQWLDDRLRLNALYFLAQYEDFIITAVNPNTGQFVTVNAAEMETDGFEADLQYLVTPALDVFLSVATLDGEYEALDASVPIPITNEPKRLPDVSYVVGLNWDFEAPGVPGRFGTTLTYSHQDDYFNGFANTDAEHSPEQDIVNLSATWRSPDERWAVTAGCQNCTDDEYFHSTLDFSALGFAVQYPGMPRTWKVSVRYGTDGR